ncbi:MAG: dihydroneopterin aldolase [Candidatus Delongbacteria bacterium]|jgi:FolB domain-containing protein|nr:dihydroneopterin aldolase [Candidatus Delongbacteria bacterium]
MLITIKNIKIDAIIGTLDHERITPQPIEIDIEFEYDASKAIENDDFNYAVDYKALTDEIITYIQRAEFYLIETLVSKVIEKLKENDEITSGRVILRKPKALKSTEYVSAKGTF